MLASQTWLVLSFAFVVACSLFAARATNHILEANLFGEARESEQPTRGASPEGARIARNKSGEYLATRNLFCSDCSVERIAESAVLSSSQQVRPTTGLPLTLVATHASVDESTTSALVRHSVLHIARWYVVGDEIPDGGEVVRVSGTLVEFHNLKTDRIERIPLVPDHPYSRTQQSAPTSPASPLCQGGVGAPICQSVRAVGAGEYDVERSALERYVRNPMQLLSGARLVPAFEQGRHLGFRLYLSPRSPLMVLGLRSGDTLVAVNDQSLDSSDAVLGLVSQLATLPSVRLRVVRNGSTSELRYDLI